MEGDLLGDFSGGDIVSEKPFPGDSLKREQNSLDDFEHLESDNKREETGESSLNLLEGVRSSTHNFLESERDMFVDQPRAPSADKLSDHMAEKFTDSESDAAGESPMHRPAEKPFRATPEPFIDQTPPVMPKFVEPIKPSAPKEEIKPVPVEPSVPKQEPKVAPKLVEQTRPPAQVIEAEVIFCQMGLVESLIYWRDPVQSGIALGSGLALLIALACCSVVSVFAYVSLLVLTGAVGFRIYKNVLQAVQKTNEGHPFKWLLEVDVSVPAERAQEVAAAATAHLNATVSELRRLFLVEDLVDSLKFGVLLWCLTYVGAFFNGMTLIILAWIALFSLPKAYEMNKAQVDANLEIARAKINEITNKVRAAVPIGRKSESDKDK